MTTELRQRIVQEYMTSPTPRTRNALISAHHYLCKRGARKFFRGTVDRAELEQVAAVGLIKATDRYSDAYDTPFEAYAWLVIVGELMHFVRDHEHLIRVPRNLRSLDLRFSAAYESLCAQKKREPSASEIAAEMSVPVAVVDQLRALRGRPVFADVETEEPGPARESQIDEHLTLSWALSQLSERELKIVRGIFFDEQTQAQVGLELRLSQRQVSRLLNSTLRRLAALMS